MVSFRPRSAIEWCLLLCPMAIGYGASALCPIGKSAGSTVPFRPPSMVFGVVWPVLFLMIGYSMLWHGRQVNGSLLYDPGLMARLLLVISLGLWVGVYGCGKSRKHAAWVMVACIGLAFAAIITGCDMTTNLLICPLLAWLLFAQHLGIAELILEQN